MKYRKITIDLDLGDRIKHFEIDNEIELKEYYKMKNKIDELQQENEILKELNVCVGCNNNPDYKSRCEKAIEYIEKYVSYYDMEGDLRDRLLNILKGEDK